LIRTSTERPEVMDKGNVVIGGITEKDIVQAITLSREIWENNGVTIVPDYTDENVSIKVVKLIQSYTKIINTNVWRK